MIEKIKCLRCGYSEFKGSLQIHHVDGNHLNESEDNLMVLCANCHLSYHQNNAWDLKDIGLKEPIKNREWYLRTKKGRRSIEHNEELLCLDIETMRTELNKVQLIIPNKESMIK